MCTLTPELRAEIAQHLRASSVIRHRMTLEDMERGLNSGRVIAGDIGSGSMGYRATGAIPRRRRR
jgi:hypothetical protein